MPDNMRDLCICSVNLYNLHVPGGHTYSSDAPHIPDTPEGRDEYDIRIKWFADLVIRLDADVIGFQELWAKRALEDVFAKAELLDQYTLIARDSPGIGKPQVAMAVRNDRKGNSTVEPGSEWIADFPADFDISGIREKHGAEEEINISISKFSRPVQKVIIQPEGTSPKPPKVTIYNCHLKSKGGTRLSETTRGSDTVLDKYYAMASSAISHTRRVLEAAALRILLDKQMSAMGEEDLSPTIVLGDLNDGTTSITTEMITGQPSYRLVRKSRAAEKSDKGLYTAETLQQYRSQRHVYYTYIYKNKLESLDHVLASEEFYDHSKKRHWSFRELEVINDHLNPSIKKKADEAGGTDHGVVRAYFDWNPISVEIEKLLESNAFS